MQENYLVRFPLLSAEEIENSPSRKDGLSAAQETKLKRKAARNIYATCRINAENFPKMCVEHLAP